MRGKKPRATEDAGTAPRNTGVGSGRARKERGRLSRAVRASGANNRHTAGTVVGGGAGGAGKCADAVVVGVANVQGTSRVDSDIVWEVEKRGTAVAIQEGGSGATCNCSH